MKIATIVGARPQFIKAAAFSRVLKEKTDWEEIIIHTGQHYDTNMSEVFFSEMEIPKPGYELHIQGKDRLAVIAQMKTAITDILIKTKPDIVLVYGDTNSTLAGALAAKELNIKLAHVEAGLRSYNLNMPEELNRIETDKISDFLFVPSYNASRNLIKEDIAPHYIYEVGDIMFDALRFYLPKAKAKGSLAESFLMEPFALLTIHRQENTDDKEKLTLLMQSIDLLAEKMRIVFPIHPRTKKKIQEFGISTKAELIDPQGYFDMLRLIQKSQLVLTDSGGLQKEAFYLNKYCITLRDETEWTELVELGANEICAIHESRILTAFEKFVEMPFSISNKPYGDGDTAKRIITQFKKLRS